MRDDSIDIQALHDRLQWLRREDGIAPESQVESVIGDILLPLLKEEGLELLVPKNGNSVLIDFAAARTNDPKQRLVVAVEYKHYGQGKAVDVNVVHQLLGSIAYGPFERALLISRFGFTTEVLEVASNTPIILELHDLSSISAWIDRVAVDEPSNAEKVKFLVRSISHEFAKLVARDSEALDHLEWRDVERMMSRVMEGLGFETTLTPPSKDGGKDLILRCRICNKTESYIVELKHWRSGLPVGKNAVTDFFNVILRENRQGGLFLSTSGYASNTSEALTELSRQKLRLGGKPKIITLCQTYVRAASGLWNPPDELPEILFE